MLSGNFYGLEIWHGIFLGLHAFSSRDFFGFYLNPEGFFFFQSSKDMTGVCLALYAR